jgi:hypothetical protein
MPDLPRQFHFVFGLRPQTEPMHLVHYLCLESCRQVNRPEAIHFHYRNEPYGPLWEAIRPALTLHRIGEAPRGFDPSRYAYTREGRIIAHLGLAYAHESDFVRMDALIEHGGIYADMDTLFVRPYPQAWLAHDFLIGEEPGVVADDGLLKPSLCNAVMLARPRARFAHVWREKMAEMFDGTWSRHSCQGAAAVWGMHPEAVSVLPEDYFYAFRSTREGLRALLEEDVPIPTELHSIHLWAHLWWDRQRTDFSAMHEGLFTEEFIATTDTTYNRLARRFLPRGG